MKPRLRSIAPAAFAAIAALSIAACGDDSTGSEVPIATDDLQTVPPASTTMPPVPSTVPVTTAPSPGIEHPTGADDVVVRIAYEGGFVPADYAFRNLPTLLVSGDGHAFQQAPMPDIYPGPLVPAVNVRTVTEQGIQDLLALAEDNGLLADVEYTSPTNIADAPDTVVEISANGATYVHRAYALGISDETDPARLSLAEFVNAATGDWMNGANAELGAEETLAPDAYLIRSMEVGDYTGDIAPTVVDWPADASIRLADAADCAELSAAEVGDLFANATQLTFFADGGITYQLAVKPDLPGNGCAAG